MLTSVCLLRLVNQLKSVSYRFNLNLSSLKFFLKLNTNRSAITSTLFYTFSYFSADATVITAVGCGAIDLGRRITF